MRRHAVVFRKQSVAGRTGLSALEDDSGKEVTQEVLYSDYKEVDGIKHPMKITINRDGDKCLDGETTDLKLVEKLDESEFAKP